jgi:hypothetical protein
MLIDSLVVELGLDPTKFNKQQKEALEGFKNFRESAIAGAKDVENQSKKSGEALGGIKTQALELFAVFTGGKSLINFSEQLIHSNAALGRLDRNLGISSSTISKWQGAARIFGGDAASMAQSFTSISDALAGWKIGIISPLVADFRAISTAGGHVIDINKGVEESFLTLADNLKAIHDRDPAQAGLLGRRAGLDPALFDLLIRGREGAKEVLDYVQKIGIATKDDTDAFGELEKRLSQMGLKAESLGRKLLGGKGGGASMIMELADILNMSPSEAWAYINKPDRKPIGQNGRAAGAPGGNLFSMPSGGAFTSQSDKEAFIRSEAAARGINPDVALAVAKSEGFSNPVGDNGTSFGAFQLHVTPDGRGNAVGDQFKKATGRDPSDPANERAAIQFALDDARAHGWGAYHGAARVGIGAFAGIDHGGGSTTTTHVTINGLNVTAPQGSDPTDFANRFAAAVKRQSYAAQANDGQN